MPGHIILRGEKVSLYTITKEDLKKIWKYLEDKDIRREIFCYNLIVYPEDLDRFYNEIKENKNKVVLAIVRNEDKEILGVIYLIIKDLNLGNAELEYWIAKEYRNKGYTTEAVKLMLKYAFEYLNLFKVHAEVDETNIASRRVLEKSGFKLVGRLRKHSYFPGKGRIDLLFYDILKEEWKINIQIEH